MTDVLPTTVRNLERNGRSPCCNTQLVLSSPPDGYRCRECDERYDIEDADTCAVVKSDDEVCGRTLPCQYHS